MDVTLKNQTSDVGVKESVPDPRNNGVGADSCETVATESIDKQQTVTEEPPTDAEDDRPSDVMEESQSARSDDTMQNGLDESADRGVEDELNLGSKDDEVSMNPSESIANPGEDDTSMNVSEGDGEQSMEAVESEQPMEADDQSMDQDMQVEKADKDISETMDVSVANVDIQGGDESMEVASPSAVDPICLGNTSGESQGPTCEEQMEINEAVEDDSTIQTTDKADEDIEKSEEVSEAEKKSDEEQHEDKAEEGTSEQERITEDTQESNVGGATADPAVAETEDTQDSNASAPTGETTADPAVAETEDTQDSNASAPTGGATADPIVAETEDTQDSNASAPPTGETAADPAVAETEDTQDSNASEPTGGATADPIVTETEGTQDSNASAPTGKTTADPVEAETEDTQDSSVKAPSGEGTVAETGQKETIAEVQDSNASKPESESTEENKESKKDGVIVFSGSVLKSSEKEQKTDDGDIVEVVVEKPRSGRKSSNAERKSETSYSPEPEQRPQRPKRQAATRAETQIKELAEEDSNSNEGFGDKKEIVEIEPCSQMCFQCCRVKVCHFQGYAGGRNRFLCEDTCVSSFRKQTSKTRSQNLQDRSKRIDTERIFVRKCSQCSNVVKGEEKNLSWETMDFCNEECLGKYQTALGSHCANCKGAVQPVSLGKYCVRFGYDIKQFCCSTCLEEFKKGLKVCSYCQKDISSGAEGFLAPVGDKGQFKDFCTQQCMEKYDQMSNNQPPPLVMHCCSVCQDEKIVKVEVLLEDKLHKLCSEPCFAAFKFVNNINADRCDMCKKYFDRLQTEVFSVYYDDSPHSFCCKTCMNVYILANRKIVPCNWCKVKKYNFDMIKRVDGKGQVFMMCSLNCLTLYQVSLNAVSAKRIKCDYCSSVAQAQYHLTMSDATIRNFCTYQCVMSYQGQFSKTTPLNFSSSGTQPIPTGGPQRAIPNARRSVPITQNETQLSKGSAPTAMPVISNVTSLATHNGPQVNNSSNIPAVPPQPPKTFYKQQVIVKPPPPKEMKNKSVLCKPYMHTKGVSCRPHPCTKETQTDDSIGKKIFIPVPVPIYVPAPMHMYSNPFPVPVPFPLPVPVPIFIPTTRNSAQGIMKEIKRIQEKIPTDPFEAELLMMAEMVAGEKKAGENSDSESDDGGNGAGDVSEVPGGSSAAEGGFSPEAVDTSNTFGEDMLQMALKMASELEEPAVDLEAALTPSTITAQSQPSMEQNDATESEVDDPEPVQSMPEARANRGRKRGMRSSRGGSSGGSTPAKRGRRISSSVDIPLLPPPEPQPPPRVEQEKPDANMCLKYTFGVNAWRQWVMAKNAELEKAATNNRKLKLFKPEILQLTADELNYSLCLFVKEVRKPNGSEYAPDTIYYLCLGIQQYLFENGRIDNIFTDSYYEKFTECLDEVAKKFTALYNDSQYIVTRVEEEHLWESKQLGAHSPHVLLSTLMFFNTKHFNLTTVEEHMQLSFSHIMKHWKRNPNQPGVTKIPGSSRNVLLRFYPPQSALENNARKKKVYEQQENEENPLRCPVKLYEFYLSKCPESVKTRNDVFYLLPERSCVPDSPVWYSTMALGKEPLMKMLHRVKMVKEINIALLTS